jgi:hypothetical protein
VSPAGNSRRRSTGTVDLAVDPLHSSAQVSINIKQIHSLGRTVIKQLLHWAAKPHSSIDKGLMVAALSAASVAFFICAQLP